MTTPAQSRDFPPIIYAFLAGLVVTGFVIAGRAAWYWVAIAPLSIYCSERFWQSRKARR